VFIFGHERQSSPDVFHHEKDEIARQSVIAGLNFTEEMISENSITRQLGDQMTLAKAYVVLAKENNNLQFCMGTEFPY
jgi:alpha-1,4-galacturonosyltransferase